MKPVLVYQNLHDYYPQSPLPKISIGAAVGIIRRQFCNPMIIAGKCTAECNNCQPYLAEMFHGLDAGNTRSYPGVLNWLCKNIIAQMREEEKPKERTQPTDAFDRPIEVNAFQEFIQAIRT